MTRDNKPVYSPVYSTDGGDLRKNKTSPTRSIATGPAKMRLETGGRGGKSVTVLFNLPMDEAAAKQLMKEMQSAFGCGATFKDNTVELRGDVRDRVEAFFTKKNMKIIRAGGR